jgi:hypothetical protein
MNGAVLRVRKSHFFLLSTVVAAACGSEPPVTDQPSAEIPDDKVLITFEAVVDPSTGTIEVVDAVAQTSKAITQVTVVQDGVAGQGPVNTVELVTENTGLDAQCGTFAFSVFCGDVRLRSFYTQPLANAVVHLTSISNAANHAPVNSDGPFMGLPDTFGNWIYGSLPASGGNRLRRWIFRNDGTAFSIRGEVWADVGVNDPSGCSDGQREGFTNLATHPNIAGCSGGFSLPGVVSVATPACGRVAGDDSNNPNGTGCNIQDLCAEGWHVCTSPADVASDSPTGCTGATTGGPTPRIMFVQRTASSNSFTCGPGVDNFFGCASFTQGGIVCSPLNASGGNLCSNLLSTTWRCGTDSTMEGNNVTKVGPANGGVLCCRN